MEVPARLYKLSEAKYARALVETGCVRVGTLSGFRAMEMDEQRRDGGEGTLTLHSDSRPRIYRDRAELPQALRGMDVELRGEGLATNNENAFVMDESDPDRFVYCVSEGTEAGTSKEWSSYATITDPPAFLRALDKGFRRAMARQGGSLRGCQIGRCVYGARRFMWHNPPQYPNWLLKPKRLAVQGEWRAAWESVSPQALKLQAVDLCIPELVGTCRFEDK